MTALQHETLQYMMILHAQASTDTRSDNSSNKVNINDQTHAVWYRWFSYPVLLQVTEHDHDRHLIVHHHLPEVSDSVLHGTLSYDECILLMITLNM